MNDIKIIGGRLRTLRLGRGLEQQEVAKHLGYKTESTISKWENGNNLPNGGKLAKLADLYDTSTDYILYGKVNNKNSLLDKITNISSQLTEKRQENVYNFAENQLNKQNNNESEEYIEENVTIIRGRATAAGSAIEVDDALARKDVVPNSTVPKGADELVEVTGDSMHPLIQKGDSIYIRYQPTVENGEIAIVRIKDEGVTCKRVYKEGSVIRLRSENDKYDDLVYNSDNITVLGKVIL